MRDPGLPLFAISVAAELAETTVPNLRVYERNGLVEPDRTAGGTRRYSETDIDRLRRIRVLLTAGLNIAGVARVLELEDEVARLKAEVEEVADQAPVRVREPWSARRGGPGSS